MKKYLTRILAAILGAALVLLPLLPGAEAEEYSYAKALYCVYGEREGEGALTFFTPDGEVCRLPCGSGEYYMDMALDRSYGFVVSDFDEDSGGVLYYVDPRGAKEIARGVYYCFSSDTGGNGAYITGCPGSSMTGALYLYDGKTGTASLMEEHARVRHRGHKTGAALSPDGRTLAWCRDDGTNNTFHGYSGLVWNRGEIIELGEDAYPVAVADNAKYVYYAEMVYAPDSYSPDSIFHVLREGEDICLYDRPGYGSFEFNRDFSEARFYVSTYDDYNAWFCVDGGAEMYPLEEGGFFAVAAPQACLAGELFHDNLTLYLERYYRYGIDSFRGKTLLAADTLCTFGDMGFPVYYVDENYGLHGPYNYRSDSFTLSGECALYFSFGELYFIDRFPESSPTLITDSCAAAMFGTDSSQIYYNRYNSSDPFRRELYLLEDGKTEKVAEDAWFISLSSNILGRSIGGREAVIEAWLPVTDGYMYFTNSENDSVYCRAPDGTVSQLLAGYGNVRAVCCEGVPIVICSRDGHKDVYRLDGASATLIVEDMPR